MVWVLIETVLLSTKKMSKQMSKKKFNFTHNHLAEQDTGNIITYFCLKLGKPLYPLLCTGSNYDDPSRHVGKIVDWDVFKIQD